jgi:hypothetical protein
MDRARDYPHQPTRTSKDFCARNGYQADANAPPYDPIERSGAMKSEIVEEGCRSEEEKDAEQKMEPTPRGE